jgi:glucose-1-phosphate adenylyltransferase
LPPIGIGDGSVVDGVIVDKNCRIGHGVHVSNAHPLSAGNTDVVVADGIIIVPKGTMLPDKWKS